MDIHLRGATAGDVPEIMRIMTTAHQVMADPSAYITDDESYVADHISHNGFTLILQADGRTAGFFLVCVPGLGGNNLGHYLDFSEEQLMSTALMDSVAVDPAFQGRGFMERMLRRAVDMTKDRYAYLLGTVAPENQPSLRTFQKCGFQQQKLVVKPQGQRRLLMGCGRGFLPE